MGSRRNTDPMNEAMVVVAMSLLGREVDAHIKDGSVFSGIFFTANLDNGFGGIVLKDARMIKKGNGKSNVTGDGLVAMLVILPADLVQVVAKRAAQPPLSDAESRNGPSQNSEALVDTALSTASTDDTKTVVENSRNDNEGRKLLANGNGNDLKVEHEIRQTKPIEARKATPHFFERPTPAGAPPSKSSHNSQLNKIAKVSKLNPEAKLFSPSFTKPSPPIPTAPLVAGVHYIPNNVPNALPEVVGLSPFGSHPPMPVKVHPYANLPVGALGPVSYFPQPNVGHWGGKAQPLRIAGPYGIPAGPGIVHPSSQSVMVGRPGPVMYVHPGCQEIVTPIPSPPFARPITIPNPHHHLQFPKHQGGALMHHQPYLMATVQQQQQPHEAYLMPHSFPFSQQPVLSNRFVRVPGTNAVFNTRFP